METLIANPAKFTPKIIEKAKAALAEGFRRPINATQGRWQQISVGRNHRILLRGNGKAELLTHEAINKYMHRKGHNI